MTDTELLAESSAIYFDACALAKVSLEEDPGSGLVRCLIYLSTVPAYCSLVGHGEFITVAGKKPTQARIGSLGYLFSCRSLMIDLELGKLHRVEPVPERVDFIREGEGLAARHGNLGGGDLWHIMAALQLARELPASTVLSFDKGLVKAATTEGLRAVNGSGVDREVLLQELKARRKWVPA